jgi:probable F420-dependent oxidoreductase
LTTRSSIVQSAAVKVDTGISSELGAAGEAAAEAERAGLDAVWCAETNHDPFLGLAFAAEHTDRIELGTAITVAFARSPMTLAATANDLQAYSEGRLLLGLGSQIKPHITKRFSMPWSHPAARMREFVMALRAIWACWHDGSRLDFRGDFYSHTLMTPFFSPGPNPHGAPKVFLAAVGDLMTEVAGEVADGIILHPFTTARYLREVTVPALERGRAKAGRAMEGFQVSYPAFVVTGANEEDMNQAAQATRVQLGFYGSTPSYRGVLETHGWGDLQPELNALSKQGQWMQMGALIDDEMLAEFAVVAEPDAVAPELLRRYGDTVTRLNFYPTYALDRGIWTKVVDELRAA